MKTHLLPMNLDDALHIETLLLSASFGFQAAAENAERLQLPTVAAHRRQDCRDARRLALAMREAIDAAEPNLGDVA